MSQAGTPYRGIINAENPNSHIQNAYSNQPPQRSLQEILDENEHLRQTIQKLKKQKEESEQRVNQLNEPKAPNQEIARRISQNNHKLEELRAIIVSQ